MRTFKHGGSNRQTGCVNGTSGATPASLGLDGNSQQPLQVPTSRNALPRDPNLGAGAPVGTIHLQNAAASPMQVAGRSRLAGVVSGGNTVGLHAVNLSGNQPGPPQSVIGSFGEAAVRGAVSALLYASSLVGTVVTSVIESLNHGPAAASEATGVGEASAASVPGASVRVPTASGHQAAPANTGRGVNGKASNSNAVDAALLAVGAPPRTRSGAVSSNHNNNLVIFNFPANKEPGEVMCQVLRGVDSPKLLGYTSTYDVSRTTPGPPARTVLLSFASESHRDQVFGILKQNSSRPQLNAVGIRANSVIKDRGNDRTGSTSGRALIAKIIELQGPEVQYSAGELQHCVAEAAVESVRSHPVQHEAARTDMVLRTIARANALTDMLLDGIRATAQPEQRLTSSVASAATGANRVMSVPVFHRQAVATTGTVPGPVVATAVPAVLQLEAQSLAPAAAPAALPLATASTPSTQAFALALDLDNRSVFPSLRAGPQAVKVSATLQHNGKRATPQAASLNASGTPPAPVRVVASGATASGAGVVGALTSAVCILAASATTTTTTTTTAASAAAAAATSNAPTSTSAAVRVVPVDSGAYYCYVAGSASGGIITGTGSSAGCGSEQNGSPRVSVSQPLVLPTAAITNAIASGAGVASSSTTTTTTQAFTTAAQVAATDHDADVPSDSDGGMRRLNLSVGDRRVAGGTARRSTAADFFKLDPACAADEFARLKVCLGCGKCIGEAGTGTHSDEDGAFPRCAQRNQVSFSQFITQAVAELRGIDVPQQWLDMAKSEGCDTGNLILFWEDGQKNLERLLQYQNSVKYQLDGCFREFVAKTCLRMSVIRSLYVNLNANRDCVPIYPVEESTNTTGTTSSPAAATPNVQALPVAGVYGSTHWPGQATPEDEPVDYSETPSTTPFVRTGTSAPSAQLRLRPPPSIGVDLPKPLNFSTRRRITNGDLALPAGFTIARGSYYYDADSGRERISQFSDLPLSSQFLDEEPLPAAPPLPPLQLQLVDGITTTTTTAMATGATELTSLVAPAPVRRSATGTGSERSRTTSATGSGSGANSIPLPGPGSSAGGPKVICIQPVRRASDRSISGTGKPEGSAVNRTPLHFLGSNANSIPLPESFVSGKAVKVKPVRHSSFADKRPIRSVSHGLRPRTASHGANGSGSNSIPLSVPGSSIGNKVVNVLPVLLSTNQQGDAVRERGRAVPAILQQSLSATGRASGHGQSVSMRRSVSVPAYSDLESNNVDRLTQAGRVRFPSAADDAPAHTSFMSPIRPGGESDDVRVGGNGGISMNGTSAFNLVRTNTGVMQAYIQAGDNSAGKADAPVQVVTLPTASRPTIRTVYRLEMAFGAETPSLTGFDSVFKVCLGCGACVAVTQLIHGAHSDASFPLCTKNNAMFFRAFLEQAQLWLSDSQKVGAFRFLEAAWGTPRSGELWEEAQAHLSLLRALIIDDASASVSGAWRTSLQTNATGIRSAVHGICKVAPLQRESPYYVQHCVYTRLRQSQKPGRATASATGSASGRGVTPSRIQRNATTSDIIIGGQRAVQVVAPAVLSFSVLRDTLAEPVPSGAATGSRSTSKGRRTPQRRQLQEAEAEDADEDAELLDAFGRQLEGVAATSTTGIHVPSGSCL